MSSLRWYHTQRWRRRAALQLKLHPLCAICLQNGQIVPATDADHIVPHTTNGRSGMASYNRYADRVTGASNKKKRSTAIAPTSASTVGLLIQGTPPTSRG